MEFESIKKIVEAEQEAEQIKENARQKAEAILAQTERTKENVKVYFSSQFYAKQKEFEQEQKEKNTETISKIKADSTEKLQKIKEDSKEKISEAVEKIFSKVVKL